MTWISVADRIPDRVVEVLCFWDDQEPDEDGDYGFIGVGYLNPQGIWLNETGETEYGNPTHWMPLPDKPDKQQL